MIDGKLLLKITIAIWLIVSIVWYIIESKYDSNDFGPHMPGFGWSLFFGFGGISIILFSWVVQ